MARKGKASDHILNKKEYELVLKLCASVKDVKKSIEVFFFHLMLGYGRMRPGTLCHYEPSWYDPERQVIQVPSHADCHCGDCKRYARQIANNDDEDRSVEEIMESYWRPKEEGTARPIYLGTERQVRIVEKYNEIFRSYEDPRPSYSTLWRRTTKIIEISSVCDTREYKPYVNRASAITHFAWAGIKPAGLKANMGWENENTVMQYLLVTGVKAAEAMDDMYGRETETLEIDDDPPTWEEYREEVNELHEIENWTPEKGSAPNTPPPERDREHLDKITDFLDDEDETSSIITGPATATASVSRHYTRATARCGFVGLCALSHDPDSVDPFTKSGALQMSAATATMSLMMISMIAVGFSWTTCLATGIVGAIVAAYDTELE